MLKFSANLESYTRALSTQSSSAALIVSFCDWLRAQMHSALIHIVRGYAACRMTTAHQRHPISVPLVLEDCSTQTITHLVDIIQTVSRILFKTYLFVLYGLYHHPLHIFVRKYYDEIQKNFSLLGDRRVNMFSFNLHISEFFT